MIEKWVNFKCGYLEISFLRENWVCATSPYHRRYIPDLHLLLGPCCTGKNFLFILNFQICH